MIRRLLVAATAAVLVPAGALLVLSQTASAATPSATTTLVSRDTGTAGTIGLGQEPALSGDGRYLTFESDADFGGLNPSNFHSVWLRDRLLNTTTLISRATGASGAIANDGNGGFSSGNGGASVSDDGRYVVFSSAATNLVTTPRTTRCDGNPTAPDPNLQTTAVTVLGGTGDVFLRDTVAGTTTLISHNALGTGPGNDFSDDPRISADGSTITFASAAKDLTLEVQGNASCKWQVFAYNRVAGTATVVSRASNTAGPVLGAEANQISDSNGSMSSDGNLVAFSSQGTNLTADVVTTEQVFVRNLTAGTTTLVSRQDTSTGAPSNGNCNHPTITRNGNLVAFVCDDNNLTTVSNGNEDVYVRNRTAETITLVSLESPGGSVSTDASAPVISGDGSLVVYESTDTVVSGGPATIMVVATDLASGANTILSRADGATGALGNQGSTDIAVNSDGSQVAFESTATNLTTDTPTGGATHTFIRGLYPIPTATPLPTPHVGATSPTSGWPGTGLLAILAGAITIATVAVTTRRRAGPTP